MWLQWLEDHRQRVAVSPVLLRHVRQAERLKHSLDALRHERLVAAVVLDRIPVPVVVVDREGGTLAANSAARQLALDTTTITLGRQSIGASTPELTRRLVAAIRSVVGDHVDGQKPRQDLALSLPRGADQHPLHVLIVAVGVEDDIRAQDGRAAACLFIGDSDCEVHDGGDRMKRLFHFTGAETRIAVGLANGCAVNQLAERLKLSRNTVRWHVKHVLQKAGVKTQAQFVRLIHRSPAGLR
jgi:DNA-binding CsgD family transcriptional regulator